jgi:hypothetical protein
MLDGAERAGYDLRTAGENAHGPASPEIVMKPCAVCGSNEVYMYERYFPNPGSAGGETLLPGLGSVFFAAEICPSVCLSCGHVRIFASEEARKKVKASKHWKPAD